MLDAQAEQHAIELQDAQDRSFGAGWRYGRAVGVEEGTDSGYQAGYATGREETRRAWQQGWAAYQKAMKAMAPSDTSAADMKLTQLEKDIATGKTPVH
jgi:flagellar biosynthesis/type III secretory pathway protein FliH